jgi:hypothetical protein
MVGCAGEVVQIQNYTVPDYQISGTTPDVAPSGYALSQEAQDMFKILSYGTLSVSLQHLTAGGWVTEDQFGTLDIDEDTGVELSRMEHSLTWSVKGKARLWDWK